MAKRILPQRVFARGTRTKMVRFWVTVEEHWELTHRALTTGEHGTSLSQLVVDSVLRADAPMTEATARTVIGQLYEVRDALGLVARELRRLGPEDQESVAALMAQAEAAEHHLFQVTEKMAL